MNGIGASVGAGGVNRRSDVIIVQRLLNRVRRPGPGLAVDGVVGPRTLSAIRQFQSQRLAMRQPEGRVDPRGPTLRALAQGGAQGEAPGVGSGTSAESASTTNPNTPTAEIRQEARRKRREFVRPGVHETGLTRRIIDAIAPAFQGQNAQVISAYMNDQALFWKVNYHWEYLLWMVDHSLRLDVGRRHGERLRNLRAALLSCAPDPSSGYRTSPVGRPEDRSSMRQMTRRHRILTQSKKEFRAIDREAGLRRLSRRTAKSFDYAAAPVAHPGTSKHATGYALDIAGDNALIRDTCKRLGASFVFDEKSHVHVEFKNGVAV